VQPQLLLLQKNMMMAEGVSRRLDPTLNIWTLAQPLIEGWMRENRGPEARLRDVAEDIGGALERLPRTLADIEQAAAGLANGGLKLHPESLRSFAPDGTGPRWHLPALWLALAALSAFVIFS
jgi:ubiquinone biosynthesis protein